MDGQAKLRLSNGGGRTLRAVTMGGCGWGFLMLAANCDGGLAKLTDGAQTVARRPSRQVALLGMLRYRVPILSRFHRTAESHFGGRAQSPFTSLTIRLNASAASRRVSRLPSHSLALSVNRCSRQGGRLLLH